jgi:hypothetical protein
VTDATMVIWTIYRHPTDFPGKWVMRGHVIEAQGSTHAMTECFVADTLDEARTFVPRGLTCLHRSPDDDPAIHEVWL